MKKTSSDKAAHAPAPAAAAPNPVAVVLLLATSAALCFLALFQWMELLVLQSGGKTVCDVSSTVSCEAVWSSPFATRLHGLSGMPVAGLGLVYGLLAFALSLVLTHRALSGRGPGPLCAALRLTAAVGVLSSVVLALASFSAGAACLTCIGTYVLVLGFAVVAFKLLPGPALPAPEERKGALAWSAGLAVGAYLLVLPAGLATTKPSAAGSLDKLATPTGGGSGTSNTPAGAAGSGSQPGSMTGAAAGPSSGPEKELAAFLSSLPSQEQLMVSRAVADYRGEQRPVSELPASRFQYGPKDAAVRMLEWTDIRCGHCRSLAEAMKQVKRVAPAGSLSVEPRHFPLDGTCNPSMQRPGPGTSCVAAKAQICLEGAPDFWELRDRLFENQQALTPEKVMEIASSGQTPKAKLESCMASQETAKKLQEDIELALRFNLEGTPLVVLNGRKSLPVPTFLYAMAVTGGNAQSQAFSVLPAPPEGGHGHEHGHDHDHAGHAH